MRYFPINIDVKNRLCAVVGGGNIALRKVRSLLKAGAKVRVVSPKAKDEIIELAEEGAIEFVEREYLPGDLEGAMIAFVAVDDRTVGAEVAKEAEKLNLLINVADITDQCTFTIPSSFERGDLLVTISTGARCPAMSRHMRRLLEKEVGEEYGHMLDILADARKKLLDAGIGYDKCRDLLNKMMNSDILSLIKKGSFGEAKKAAEKTITLAIQSP